MRAYNEIHVHVHVGLHVTWRARSCRQYFTYVCQTVLRVVQPGRDLTTLIILRVTLYVGVTGIQ